MYEKQKELFQRIAETQYAWLNLRGIIQNEFNEDNPLPEKEEIKEWEENIDKAINELASIKFSVLDYIHDLKSGVIENGDK